MLAKNIREPGPSASDLMTILEIAARVPDHKKLTPWRFILFQGDARDKFGSILADILQKEDPDSATPTRLETERARLLRAPVVVALVMQPRNTNVVPVWEQTLSTGAVGMNLLHAATALGYCGQWLTEWYSYSPAVAQALELADEERIAGFFYLGSPAETPSDRDRPDLSRHISHWKS